MLTDDGQIVYPLHQRDLHAGTGIDERGQIAVHDASPPALRGSGELIPETGEAAISLSPGQCCPFDPSELQLKRPRLVVRNQEAHRRDLRRIERRFAG